MGFSATGGCGTGNEFSACETFEGSFERLLGLFSVDEVAATSVVDSDGRIAGNVPALRSF